MVKVGIIGENPTDITCINELLAQKFINEIKFFPLLQNINGSYLEHQKVKHLLRKEYEYQKPNIVIFVRDLDAPRTDNIQLLKRKEYFTDFNSVVDRKGVMLLNI